MAEQGFQRDISTPIAIPQVQAPNFAQNRSNVEDIADIATVGFQIFDRVSATTKETKRQEDVAKADSNVNTLINDYNDILAQGGTLNKANSVINKRIAAMPDSTYVRDSFSKGILATRQDYRASLAQKKADIKYPDDYLDNPANAAVVQEVMLSNPKWGGQIGTKGSDLRPVQNLAVQEKLLAVQKNSNDQERLSLEDKEEEEVRGEIIRLHYEEYALGNATTLNKLSEMMEEVDKSSPEDQVKLMADIDVITTNLEQAFVRQGTDKLGPNATTLEKDTLKANAAAYFGLQRGQTKEYREASTKALKYFAEVHKIDQWKAGNIYFFL